MIRTVEIYGVDNDLQSPTFLTAGTHHFFKVDFFQIIFEFKDFSTADSRIYITIN